MMQINRVGGEDVSNKRMGIIGACTSNMLNMIGVGPFLSIPLVLAAVHGSYILLAWILGAVVSICDGLVWAELGSAMPSSGGPYFYVRHAFGEKTYGRAASFLVLWSSVLTAPLLIASGAVGFAQYFHSLWPAATITTTHLGICVCLVNVVLLYRRITTISAISIGLWLLVVGTILWIIFSGVGHIPFSFKEQLGGGYSVLPGGVWKGMGAATLIAVYDYAGYYNVCFLGSELKRPERTIPYSILLSIVIVAVLYIAMNLAILGVLPIEQSMHSEAVVADYMSVVYSAAYAKLADVLILIASFASVFAILLGYSRVPFEAAKQGDFFRIFAKEHPAKGFPYVALLALGCVSSLACFLSLSTLISLVIVIQAMVQFIAQCVAVVLLRKRALSKNLSIFRMPLYPLPVLIALLGWIFILASSGIENVVLAFMIVCVGLIAFFLKARQEQKWPFEKL